MCGGVAELSYLTAASKRWGKNSRASVASYPTLTFFLKSVLEYLLCLQVHFL